MGVSNNQPSRSIPSRLKPIQMESVQFETRSVNCSSQRRCRCRRCRFVDSEQRSYFDQQQRQQQQKRGGSFCFAGSLFADHLRRLPPETAKPRETSLPTWFMPPSWSNSSVLCGASF